MESINNKDGPHVEKSIGGMSDRPTRSPCLPVFPFVTRCLHRWVTLLGMPPCPSRSGRPHIRRETPSDVNSLFSLTHGSLIGLSASSKPSQFQFFFI